MARTIFPSDEKINSVLQPNLLKITHLLCCIKINKKYDLICKFMYEFYH